MKKILIIKMGPWDTLESSNIRALSMAKGFIEQGYQIDWIGVKSPYTYPMLNKNLIEFASNINFTMLENNSMHIGKRNSGNVIKRTFHEICHRVRYRISVYDYYKKIADSITKFLPSLGKYDYLISISNPPTSHLAAKNLLKSGKVNTFKWIEYWGDPIIGDVSERHKKNKKRQLKAERLLFDGCDKIVFTSVCTLEEERKIHVDLSDRMEICPTPYLNKKISIDDNIFTVGYYGAYRKHIYNIVPFYNACRKLNSKFHTNIIGNSDRILESTDKITILPRSDVFEYEKITDLYVCILPIKGNQLPGKVYQNAGSNRPVLIILDGNNGQKQRKYLETFGRYYFCNNDEDDIKNAIEEIANNNICWQPSEYLDSKNISEQFLR